MRGIPLVSPDSIKPYEITGRESNNLSTRVSIRKKVRCVVTDATLKMEEIVVDAAVIQAFPNMDDIS